MEFAVFLLLLFSQFLPDLVTDKLGLITGALILLDNFHFVFLDVDLIGMRWSLGHDSSFRVLELLLSDFG
jgi:hypothetical protein